MQRAKDTFSNIQQTIHINQLSSVKYTGKVSYFVMTIANVLLFIFMIGDRSTGKTLFIGDLKTSTFRISIENRYREAPLNVEIRYRLVNHSQFQPRT